MNNTCIDITEFFNSCNPKYYYASRAELGINAGQITWENAVDKVDDYRPLDTAGKVDAFRLFAFNSGGWNDAEVNAWSDDEVNALCIQWISGDMREAGIDQQPVDWEQYESDCERGQCASRIYGGPMSTNGRVYFDFSE